MKNEYSLARVKRALAHAEACRQTAKAKGRFHRRASCLRITCLKWLGRW
jgi:hypothetical protein